MHNILHTARPVRTTIFYGLGCALIFIPLGLLFEHTIFWSLFLRTSIVACILPYALILASWSGKKRISVIFPLLFLLIFVFNRTNDSAFLLLCLGMFSWIRSGVCFQNAFSKALVAEILFSIGGGALVAVFEPHSIMTWALGIWMFFLVQSVYFIVMTDVASEEDSIPTDAFEQARIRAEGILKA